jgi:hypothetical protein
MIGTEIANDLSRMKIDRTPDSITDHLYRIGTQQDSGQFALHP